jgi:hypothetical protein
MVECSAYIVHIRGFEADSYTTALLSGVKSAENDYHIVTEGVVVCESIDLALTEVFLCLAGLKAPFNSITNSREA